MNTAVGSSAAVPPPAGGEPVASPDTHPGPTPPVTFEQLFHQRYEPMMRVAFLLVGSRAEAEDVVQDAFARVDLRWSRIDNPSGYLHRCVVNRAHDVLRRRRVEQRLWWMHRPETSELDADEMGDALAALPPARRTAVVLRYYAGLSEQQIAEAMGVRPGTVKSMLHRAMAELKRVIER